MPDPIETTPSPSPLPPAGEGGRSPGEGAPPREKVYGSPRERLEDEVRRLNRSLESLAAVPHEVARLRKELDSLKGMPREIARSEGACAAARRSTDNRLRTVEGAQQRMTETQKEAAERLEHAAMETAHLSKAVEAVRQMGERATEALTSWKAARQELEVLSASAKHSAEGLAALAGLPRELSAATEAANAAQARAEGRFQELETASRAILRAQEEAARSIETLRQSLSPLLSLPQRFDAEREAESARARAEDQRIAQLEIQVSQLERQAASLETFAKGATRHLDGILQRVAEALPEDALNRICARIEELEGKVARLELKR